MFCSEGNKAKLCKIVQRDEEKLPTECAFLRHLCGPSGIQNLEKKTVALIEHKTLRAKA